MKPEVFSKEFVVPASAIDELNHVNNITYLEWCLEIAESHWMARSTEAIREKYVWMVLNHFISYKNQSFEGETLRIETWISNNEGVKSERSYKITRPSDGKTIVEAKTLWCLLDAKTFRPMLVEEDMIRLFME